MENKMEELTNEKINRKKGKHSIDSKEEKKFRKSKIQKIENEQEEKEESSFVNKVFNSIIFVLLIGVILFLKTMFFYNNTIAINENLELKTIIGTISFIATIVLIISAIPNRGRIVLTILLDFIYSLLLLMDQIYYKFATSFLSVLQIENLQYGEAIIDTLPSLLELKQIVYFCDILLIILLFIFRIVKIVKKKKCSLKYNIIRVCSLICAIILIFSMDIKYVQNGGKNIYNKDLQMREATIFGYHIYDINNAIDLKHKTKYKKKQDVLNKYDELKNVYNEKYKNEQNQDLKGVLEGKNVIIIQLESVQEFVLNKIINDKEITPNFNKFIEENIEISNMHMQSYSTTADCEHSVINSLYPIENGLAFSKYFANKYDDIFGEFNKKGYHTSFMHGNYPYFWNRGNVYSRLNLNSLELKDEFSDLSENINGDLSDELLYKQAVEKIKSYNSPSFSYIVSASSHTPFTLEGLKDRSKISIDVGKYKDTYFGNYLEAVNYADYAFGKLIEELKENDLYDDTAILIFGDHNGLTMYDEDMVDFLKNFDDDVTPIDLKLNYTKVLAGMKIPGINKKNFYSIDKPVSKLDIKPTLAFLCGTEDRFSVGTNMFDKKDFVSLNNERIISNNYYYDEVWYEIETGNEVDLNTLNEETKELLDNYYKYMKDEIEISNSVIINNLLANY